MAEPQHDSSPDSDDVAERFMEWVEMQKQPPGYIFDEYLKVTDSTGRVCLKKFCKAIIRAFRAYYLCRPTSEDVQRLIHMHETRHGFPGMLGSLEELHWAWKNCPKAWHDAYTRGGTAVPVVFHANQREYQMSYYLCDDIYPKWRCFVKSPPMATNSKEARFKKMQESTRKDVERAFGVLQARWGII
ncbi:uncharacterized protein LOC131003647 [Salvia miltiorrhiza]|uniref:uncharacterized protein LOC131003647 n=1 Tax=Salvia miltiorrhiza TaxID=226208 RepID=UPI0025AC34FB|nr:uncharacterized protein LOC131003647 [Salvia miltiorrhiza]